VRNARTRAALLGVAAIVVLAASCRRDRPDVEFADADSPQELVNAVAGVVARIERISGLERTAVLRMRWQTRDEARGYVEQRLENEMPPARLEAIRRTYVALGLLPDTLDLRALLLDLYTEQVLGYYDPREGTLYVIRGGDLDGLQPVLIHELVHALQDQHADLEALVAEERGNDRQTAAHAALEGHAMVVMFAVLAEQAMRRQVDPAALPNPADELGPALTAQNEQFPVIAQAPRIVRETLLFPYVHGSDFVHRLWRSMQGLERYPAPIDSLLPQSTAQVLRPVERFIEQRLEPVELRFDAAPAGWRALHDDTFGQLETAIFLAEHSGDGLRAAANGWAGDRYVLLELASTTGPDGGPPPTASDVLQWISVWESEAEADRFAAAVRATAARRPTRGVAVDRIVIDGLPAVMVLDAPQALRGAAVPRLGVRRVDAPPSAGLPAHAGPSGSAAGARPAPAPQ
jgi:hypothetical protein